MCKIDYSPTSYKLVYDNGKETYACKGCMKEFDNIYSCCSHAYACKDFKSTIEPDSIYMKNKENRLQYKPYNKKAIYFKGYSQLDQHT